MFDSSNSNQTSQAKNGLYLIQRLAHRTNPEGRKGVDKYVIHDYMGSAEFEFGAIPATWKQFRNNSQDLVRTSVQLPGLSFFVYIPQKHQQRRIDLFSSASFR